MAGQKASNLENPYKPPAATPPRVERKKPIDRPPSWTRGLAYALPLFFIGAAIPFLSAFLTIFFATIVLSGNEDAPELFDPELFSHLTEPCLACGTLFFLAAIRNFSPSQHEGFVKCLIRVGIAGIVWMFFAHWADFLFRVLPSGTNAPWLLRALIVVLIPACYTYLSTKKQMAKQALGPANKQ